MNFGRAIAWLANDPVFTWPDDAVAGVITNVGTLWATQEVNYLPNHAAKIVWMPNKEFNATISYGEKEVVVPVPTVYVGENPHYSSKITGLVPNQGYLKSAVIAIEIGILYQISKLKLELSEDEKTQMIERNVRAFLENEKMRMKEYINNIEKQDIISRNQKEQINILKETIYRIGSMITAPIIQATKLWSEKTLDEWSEIPEKRQWVVSQFVKSVADDLLWVVGFSWKRAT